MSAAGLERALALLEARAGRRVDALVERVDVSVGKNGLARLVLELAATEQHPRGWFRSDENGLCELAVRGDRALPFAGTLTEAAGVLAWRPGRRIVVLGGDGRTIQKGYRAGRLDAAARAHALVHASGALRTPAVHALRPELSMLVLERLEGRPVPVVKDSAELYFALGEGLAALQRSLVDAPLPRHPVGAELGVLETWRERALLALGALPPEWERGFAAIRAAAENLPPPVLGFAHRDLHDGQLLALSEGPALLDLDLACFADVALDPANLLAHFELRALQGLAGADAEGALACGEALLEGLERTDSESWARLRFYQATSFLRLALVYALRPRWSHLGPALVRFSSRCLDDLVRIP